jgi:hypothetical protein
MNLTAYLKTLFFFSLLILFSLTGCISDPTERISFSPDRDTFLIGPGDTLSLCIDYPAQPWGGFFCNVDNVRYRVANGNTFYLTWPVSDTGKHVVVLGVESDKYLPETIIVYVQADKPQVKIKGPSQAIVNDTVVFHVQGSDNDGSVTQYLWSIDKNGDFWHTDKSDSFKVVWSITEPGNHTVRVKGIDDDGLISDPDSTVINIISLCPTVSLPGDTSVFYNDTLILVSSASDSNGKVIGYKWKVDGLVDSCSSDTLILTWNIKSAGKHVVTVVAVDDDSLESIPDTIVIDVKAGIPAVNLIKDTTIYINDILKLKAVAYDSNGTITGHVWTVDGKTSENNSDSILLSWDINSTGRHIVTFSAFDNDSLKSGPDTVLIEVLPGFPVIVPIADTVLTGNDPVTVNCIASDINGIITGYVWDFDGTGWKDTSASPQITIPFTGSKSVRVLIGAIDDDGLLSVDTFNITFNCPPEINIVKPKLSDTLVFREQQFPLLFRFEALITDPNSDPFSVSMYLKENGDYRQVYSGDGDSMAIRIESPGEIRWMISAQDNLGNKQQKEGVLVIIRQHTICFLGHSIVAGDGGNGKAGGFRAGVLKGLRDSLGPFESIKTVGPLCTKNMKEYRTDDSCMAVSGIKAKDMLFVFRAFPDLKADIWVFMMGANSEFNNDELKYTVNLIDEMYSRNPQSRVYVLNSSPISNSQNRFLSNFNQELSDSVSTKKSEGKEIALVDIFTLLTNEGEFDQTFFYDNVHPNQTGYDMMSEEILQVMLNPDSPAVFLQGK